MRVSRRSKIQEAERATDDLDNLTGRTVHVKPMARQYSARISAPLPQELSGTSTHWYAQMEPSRRQRVQIGM